MTDMPTLMTSEPPVETVLRDELAQGDVVLATIGPVMGHLLANHDHTLFSDEIVSRVRGMVSDVARQLLMAEAEAGGATDPRRAADEAQSELAAQLLCHEPLVAHCHALALEWQLTERLERRNDIDPVLAPLLQALVASDDQATAAISMAALAAQARFVQHQRRMELPLGELPPELYHVALSIWIERAGPDNAKAVLAATGILREKYDESASRAGLLSRLVAGMGHGVLAALSIGHSGVSIFLSALAAATGQSRERVILATNDRQLARLALSLRAAGLKPRAIEEQFLTIHPDVALPEGFDALRVDRAAALLAGA